MNESSPPRIEYTALSRAARAMFARLQLAVVMPVMLAFPCGRFGVLSPLKNGRTKTPSQPGFAFSASASNAFTSRSRRARISSEATVQFIVHSNGRYPPVDEQKPEIPFAGSATLESLNP